jgi:hypothetical protein
MHFSDSPYCVAPSPRTSTGSPALQLWDSRCVFFYKSHLNCNWFPDFKGMVSMVHFNIEVTKCLLLTGLEARSSTPKLSHYTVWNTPAPRNIVSLKWAWLCGGRPAWCGMTASILINLKLADVIFTAVFLIKEECCCSYYNNNIDPWVGTERPQCHHRSLEECYKCECGLFSEISLNFKREPWADFNEIWWYWNVSPKFTTKLELSLKLTNIHTKTHTRLCAHLERNSRNIYRSEGYSG